MYRRVFYGGSFYDGLRVKEPTEFDLDLLLDIPRYSEPVLSTSNLPGFVHLQLKNFDGFMKQPEAHLYKNFEKLFDKEHYLDTKKVLAWMEGVLQKSLNEIGTGTGNCRTLNTEEGRFMIKFNKGGPALTLKVENGQDIKLDIDLVTCFVFTKDRWPSDGFRANPVQSKPDFFIVPKIPKVECGGITERYWRLSFQEQERVLMDNKRTLKPTVKLLKKLRDNLGHDPIASYYIKTVALWLNERRGDDLWNNSLSYVFMIVLKEYQQFIADRQIPFYWYKRNNLIGNVKGDALINISNRLKIVINNVDKQIEDPTVIAKFLLNSKEYEDFKRKFKP